MEGTHRPVDLRLVQRQPERLRVARLVEWPARPRRTEHALVVALESRAAAMLEQLARQASEGDGAFRFLRLRRVGLVAYPRLLDAQGGAGRVGERDVTPTQANLLVDCSPTAG